MIKFKEHLLTVAEFTAASRMIKGQYAGLGMKIEVRFEKPYGLSVPLTLEQIVEEARNWPPEKVGELVGRLTENLHTSDPETERAWKVEIDKRIDEIQTGKVQGIPGEAVSAKIRKILGR